MRGAAVIPLTALTGLFSGSSPWRKAALILAGVLALLVLLGVAAWRGYSAGYAKAEALGAAELERVRGEHAAARAAAQAQALRMFDAAKAAAYAAESGYLAKVHKIEAENRELSRRIENAANAVHGAVGSPCVFGDAFVQYRNEAFGLAAAGDRPVSGAAPGADAGAAPAGAPAPGVRPGPSVTAEDVAAHDRDFGGYCRQVRAQLDGLRQFLRETREAQP